MTEVMKPAMTAVVPPRKYTAKDGLKGAEKVGYIVGIGAGYVTRKKAFLTVVDSRWAWGYDPSQAIVFARVRDAERVTKIHGHAQVMEIYWS